MSEKKRAYTRIDLMRLLKGWTLLLAIPGVMLVLYFSARTDISGISGSALNVFSNAISRRGFIVAYIFCACAYGFCFSEDLESDYLRYALIRGNLIKYVAAKVAIMLFSSVFVMTIGCLLFALALKICLPWQDPESYQNVSSSMCIFLIDYHMVLLWIVLAGFLYGICAGVLTLASAYISLYIRNKMLILAMPALLLQLIEELFPPRNKAISSLLPAHAFNV
ncbi:MAG: hypothetical protein FWE59_01200 [Oscillospiraceae bacterium]|nr:hypothetical protein [Oscillospiraceae bacterium]